MASNRGKRKPHQIQQGPQADLLDSMFDEIYRRLDSIENLASSGSAHAILSATHSDTTVATPVNGDLMIRSGGSWVRLPKDAMNLKVLQLIGGIPGWGRDGSILQSLNASELTSGTVAAARVPHGLLSAYHNDVTVAAAANGDILIRTGGAWARLAKGSDGQILTLESGLPAWAAPGQWDVLTDGNVASPAIIYAGGEVIMTYTP